MACDSMGERAWLRRLRLRRVSRGRQHRSAFFQTRFLPKRSPVFPSLPVSFEPATLFYIGIRNQGEIEMAYAIVLLEYREVSCAYFGIAIQAHAPMKSLRKDEVS